MTDYRQRTELVFAAKLSSRKNCKKSRPHTQTHNNFDKEREKSISEPTNIVCMFAHHKSNNFYSMKNAKQTQIKCALPLCKENNRCNNNKQRQRQRQRQQQWQWQQQLGKNQALILYAHIKLCCRLIWLVGWSVVVFLSLIFLYFHSHFQFD